MSVVGIPSELPILSIINEVVFPGHFVRIAVTHEKGKKLINSLLNSNEKPIGICTVEGDTINSKTIRKIGVFSKITEIKKLMHKPGYLIVAKAITRFKIENFISEEPFFKANVKELIEVSYSDEEMIKLIDEFRSLLDKFLKTMQIDSSTIKNLKQVSETTPISTLIDMMAPVWKLSLSEKISLLETIDAKKRLKLTIEHLNKRILTQSKLQRSSPSKSPANFLGHEDDHKDYDEIKKKIDEIEFPEDTKTKIHRDLIRLERLKTGATEYDILRTYLELVADLPWNKTTEDSHDIKKAEEILEKEHTGLDVVKRRIIEYLSVKKLTKEIKGPILCFHGPPGVGKTSLGKSIAKSLGRRFVRISLGGVRDESVIRGHRRTYVGAIAGRIIDGLRRAGTKNPVFLLDEIDKLGNDHKGDPSSALLEVLDPEQNNSFEDHYLGVPFDLSQVLFIATANQVENIPAPLVDRMEMVEIPGYSFYEKVKIAEEHLVTKQITLNGLSPKHIEIPKDTLLEIASKYTRESGVRELERLIGSICRYYASKYAKNEIMEESNGAVIVRADILETILGNTKHDLEPRERLERPGVAIGLAWTPVGGNLLFVEATKMGGKGKLILTGQLGDVIKESAQAALSWIRSNAVKYNLSSSPSFNMLDETDIHIHFPAGSVKKDGPSAGVTILSVLFSILIGKSLRSDTAMTGEITLRGLVLPVGGIKEKVLAAHRAGIKRVLLPQRNKKDLIDIPLSIQQEIEFIFIRSAEKLLENIFPEGDLAKPLSLSAL